MGWDIPRRVQMRSLFAFAFPFIFVVRMRLRFFPSHVLRFNISSRYYIFSSSSFYQLFDKESLAANLDDLLFTANDAVGTSGQFLELKRLSDALVCLQQQQHLTNKSSPKNARRGHAMASHTGSKSTAVTSSLGSDGGGTKGKLKNSSNNCYDAKSDEGVQGSRGSGGGGEGEGTDVGGEGEGGEGGEGEGEEWENPRLSEARREYPGFNLTGPDIYTSADDHCLQVSCCPMLSCLFPSCLFLSSLYLF